MADNVNITPGAGVAIASDEVGGAQYQRVKLSIGAEGAATDAPGDSTDGYKVQAKLLANATAAIGKLGANSGVDIGDVDVFSLPALVAGTAMIGAVKTEPTLPTRVSLRVALTGSQTGTTVWDPTTGKKFYLRKLIVSCKTAGDVQFFDATDSGNTVIGPILTLVAGGGWSETWGLNVGAYVSAAVDNILKYTTSTFAGSVYVEGWEV